MDAVAIAGSLLAAWAPGVAVLLALSRRGETFPGAGELAWLAGAGWFVGIVALGAWMRALSLAGLPFGALVIAGPLVAAAVALAWHAARRQRTSIARALRSLPAHLRSIEGSPWQRAAFFALLGWLLLRAALLLTEVSLRPLFPWEAWTRWATKARVFCDLGTIVPFADAAGWFAAGGAKWFDGGPAEPLQVPLLQAWTCVALGRFDDVLIGLPWWLTALALSLAVYGALRRRQLAPLAALVGVFVLASLPLFDTHVALAGYADLPLAGFVTLAVLAFLRFRATRAAGDGAIAAVFLLACPLTKAAGAIWLVALAPALAAAWWPAHARRIAAGALAALVATLVALTRFDAGVAGRSLHLDFAPAWAALGESLFLLDNWHLLWYGVLAAALLGWRQAIAPALAPLTLAVGGGGAYALVVWAFPAARAWFGDTASFTRTLLVATPLACVWLALTVQAWADARAHERAAAPAAA
jgi:hypothetical protein